MALFSNPLSQHILGVQSKVLYSCECEQWKTISKLYFCKHCIKLRCSNCVAHEVDSFFCPNCLENMPSAEAKLKKNRCANCFDCPSCGHTLSVRATTLHPLLPNPLVPNPLETTRDLSSPLVKKMHYLFCSFCRWTSRDVGLPDQATPSGGWAEQDLPYGKSMMGLLDYYKQVAHQEKMEKERQKMSKRRTNIYIMDRYGYGLSSAGKKSSLSAYTSRTRSNSQKEKDLEAPLVSVVEEDIDLLSDSYYETLDLEDVLTLDQRLHEPGIRATSTKDLYPKHKHLMVRRSQRCKECEHNIFKPEFNPSSIKFKIQLGCIQYCPMIQLLKGSNNLTFNKPCIVIFCITNPLDTIMNVRFDQLDGGYHGYKKDTGLVDLPTSSLPIAAKDATVEFDVVGTSSTEIYDDDPAIVQSRSANKLYIYVSVRPQRTTGDVISTFKMTYDYKLITTPLIRKSETGGEAVAKPEEHLVTLSIYVRVNFGAVDETLC